MHERATAVISSDSDIHRIRRTPNQYAALHQNYPNPFNPETTIDYALPNTGNVRLAVYDMTGRTVAVLIDGVQVQGQHTAHFNADGLPTGSYMYRLVTDAGSLVRTMTLVK